MEGVWESARANIEMYLDSRPEGSRVPRGSGHPGAARGRVGSPSWASRRWPRGESLEDFLADRSSYEEFDAQAAGEREYHFVELYQQAMRHLIG